MKTARKASKIIMIVSAVLALLFLMLMIYIIFKNKDLLRKDSARDDIDGDDRYRRMKANAEDDSDIGVSIVRGAIGKQSAFTVPGDVKASHKSLVI